MKTGSTNVSDVKVPSTLPKVVIAIDPGGTTGIAYWVRREGLLLSQQLWGRSQVGPCNNDIHLRRLFQELGGICRFAEPFISKPVVDIIFESFDFRHDEQFRDKIDYIAAEVNGAIRLWSTDRPYVRLIRSGASLGKGFWSDDKIKKLGLWIPGNKHAMDATRHLLRYMAFNLLCAWLFEPFRPESEPLPWDTATSSEVIEDLRRAKQEGSASG